MSEATLWAKRGPIPMRRARVWDVATQSWIQPVDEMGRPLMERVPQSGKVGIVRQVADIDALKPMRERRFITYMHTDGNVCNDVITSAAASSPGTDRSFEAQVRAKARHHGWIEQGTCPVDEAMGRRINPQSLTAPLCKADFKTLARCSDIGRGKPPCKHWIAEEAARKARRGIESQLREETARTAADRQTDALVDLVQNLKATTAPTDNEPAKGPKK